MAKQTPLLVKTFGADSGITTANVCVVMSGTNPGNAALPGGALAAKFLGVSEEGVSPNAPTGQIGVRVAGIAQIQTDGSAAIAAGDYLAIANSSGQVKSISPASGANLRQIIGVALNSVSNSAGLLADVLIQPMVYFGA